MAKRLRCLNCGKHPVEHHALCLGCHLAMSMVCCFGCRSRPEYEQAASYLFGLEYLAAKWGYEAARRYHETGELPREALAAFGAGGSDG